jgi:hypothetical protein
MKKKITKIWSVGLVLVLAVSLLIWAAPVSASTLAWGDEDLPDELEVGNITDLAVSLAGGLSMLPMTEGLLVQVRSSGQPTAARAGVP